MLMVSKCEKNFFYAFDTIPCLYPIKSLLLYSNRCYLCVEEEYCKLFEPHMHLMTKKQEKMSFVVIELYV